MNLFTEKKIMDLENRLVDAKGEMDGVGWLGSLGLIYANYCFWNGLAMRSFCVALTTMSRYNVAQQWEKNLCIHVCVTGSPCCKVCWGNNNKKQINKQINK